MKSWDISACNKVGFIITFYSQFQLLKALECGQPILNAASAGDIPQLWRYGAINLDVRTKEQLRQVGLQIPKNYVEGSVFDIPYKDGEFQTVVLGEFLEHATYEAGVRALKECRRVLKPGGFLVATFPLDGRPNGVNRPGDPEGADDADLVNLKESGEWSSGVTVHHQTWWSNKMLHDLMLETGFEEKERAALLYTFTAPVGGWGLVWQKPA